MFGGTNRIYRKSSEAFLTEVKGKTLSMKDIKIDAYRGKELVYKTATEFGKARFILIGKRLYVLQASIPTVTEDKSAIDHYLDSFKPIYRCSKRKHHA